MHILFEVLATILMIINVLYVIRVFLKIKFRLVDDPVLASWEIRFVIINNYLAFYTIDEEKQTVIVVRFLYQKSNWCSILRQGFPLV